MARKTLEPSDITAIIDTREQRPWDLSPLKSKIGTLDTADYSICGLESYIRVERKSLPDLLGCIGNGRERFEREISRLKAYPSRCVIVEASWSDLEAGQWRSQVRVESVIGSVIGWIAAGIPFILAENAERAGKYASRFMFLAARRHWHELQSFYSSLKISS